MTTCPTSRRADKRHGYLFDGDDPYVVCVWCHERRAALAKAEEGAGSPLPWDTLLPWQRQWIEDHRSDAPGHPEQGMGHSG